MMWLTFSKMRTRGFLFREPTARLQPHTLLWQKPRSCWVQSRIILEDVRRLPGVNGALRVKERAGYMDIEKLRRMCEQEPTPTLKEIAAHFGVTHQYVHQVIREFNIVKPRCKRPVTGMTCPDCGGKKERKSTRCKKCYGVTQRGNGFKDAGGYIRLPRHLRAHFGILFRHQLVAMWKLKRPLRPEEEVHHIDGNPLNNHPCNLMVVTRKEHMAIDRRHQRRNNRTAESPNEG